MELATVQCGSSPLHFPPENLFLLPKSNISTLSYRNYKPKLSRRRRSTISASSSSSSSSSGSDGFSWLRLSQSILRGSQRFFEKMGESVKKETGFDAEDVIVTVDGLSSRAQGSAQDSLDRVNSELLPQFVSWNKWERWKVCLHCRSHKALFFLINV